VIDWIKAQAHWIFCHRTKAIGILGIIAGMTQNYLETNNIAILPAHLRGILVATFGMITFLIGLYNSIRMSIEHEDG
jgi:hypothetical protein